MDAMRLLLVATVMFTVATTTLGQFRYDNYQEKPGSCPPPLPVQICTRACFSDSHCQSIGKCCPTACGGHVCSRPVTMRQPIETEKPGSCPSTPTGRWVCSPTCSADSDCRGNKKCCRNRCGALACQNPEVEVVESAEFPVVPLSDNSETRPSDPYSNPYPYYVYNN